MRGNSGAFSTFFTPVSFATLPFFDPAGCALNAVTLRMTNGDKLEPSEEKENQPAAKRPG